MTRSGQYIFIVLLNCTLIWSAFWNILANVLCPDIGAAQYTENVSSSQYQHGEFKYGRELLELQLAIVNVPSVNVLHDSVFGKSDGAFLPPTTEMLLAEGSN